MSYRKHFSFILALLLLVTPLMVVRAAGGQLTGVVTDPKGALVPGAIVTATAPATNQKFTATTDQQGRYKIEGLPAGVYVVTITAPGFKEEQREGVQIAENQTATLDAKLELAAIGADVTVSAAGLKANADPIYSQLRQRSLAPDAFNNVATVNNLVLKRDAATFTLKSGEVYFMSPVEGRTVAAVFIGDGEVTLAPPTEIEKSSLAVFTKEPGMTEQFTQLVLRFSDKTFDEINQSPNAKMGGGAQGARARELYREKENFLRKVLKLNMETRTLTDLYTPQRPGYFMAFIGGRRWSKLLFMLDPLGVPFVSPEEVLLYSYGESDNGIWTAFHLAEEYQNNTATSTEDNRVFDISHHDVEGAIRGTKIIASDVVTVRPLLADTRVLPFELFSSLRVKSVQDDQGRELNFVQEAKDEDADVAVIYPQALEKGKEYKLRVQYEGDGAIKDSGSGNYILQPGARGSWYPNNGGTQFGDRATFNITLRYPKNTTLVSVGALTEAETQDGDSKVAKWTSGQTELAVAGFNFGRFKKKEIIDKDSGYSIEVYANEEMPDEIKAIQRRIEQIEDAGGKTETNLRAMSTASMNDKVLGEAQNSVRIFNAYFGKLAYSRIAMSQQPRPDFGQAWPTLIFMPYSAFLDNTQRAQLYGSADTPGNFFKIVAPHEVAHQWWGHMVGWTSYHDQWMSEGFAEFSASLYVQLVEKDIAKFINFWEIHRKEIVEATPATNNLKPYTIGPVTQGFRLNNAKNGAAYRFLVYPKGAYILHMIRMMMFDHKGGGDAKFREMMTDFIKTHYNKDVSTENFKAIVEKHMLPSMDIDKNGRLDWFFNQWVYGSEVPGYQLDYDITPSGDGKATVNLTVTQSGVKEDFAMLVPIYVDYGKGWTKLGSATTFGTKPVVLSNLKLPQVPKKFALAYMNDVLATSIENRKR